MAGLGRAIMMVPKSNQDVVVVMIEITRQSFVFFKLPGRTADGL